MTNGDKIRNMTDWELAEFIYNVSNGATEISVCNEKCKECGKSESWCISQIGEYLLKEVSE